MSRVVRIFAAAGAAAALAMPCLADPAPPAEIGKLTLDRSFGRRGVARPIRRGPQAFQHVALDSQERVVVCGTTERKRDGGAFTAVRILRLLPDGALDMSFDDEGLDDQTLEGDPQHLFVDAQDRILLVGSLSGPGHAAAVILRLTEDGSLDATYGDDGFVDADTVEPLGQGLRAAALDPRDGAILLLHGVPHQATPGRLARVGPDGQLDASFGGSGRADTESPTTSQQMVVDGDGGIFIAGFDRGIHRHTPQGAFDRELRGPSGGKLEIGSFGRSLLRDSAGRIVLFGRESRPGSFTTDRSWFRFLADGTLDTTFDDDGESRVHFAGAFDSIGRDIAAIGGDRWVLASGLKYGSRRSPRGYGHLVQVTDPAAPGELDAYVTRLPMASFTHGELPAVVEDVAVTADGVSAYIVGTLRRPGTTRRMPQLLKVDLATASGTLRLTDVAVSWLGRPTAGPLVDGHHTVSGRLRITNRSAVPCGGGRIRFHLTSDESLDAATDRLIRVDEFPAIPPRKTVTVLVSIGGQVHPSDIAESDRVAVLLDTELQSDPAPDVAVSDPVEFE